jgi:iron complex outermembrane receptor protein
MRISALGVAWLAICAAAICGPAGAQSTAADKAAQAADQQDENDATNVSGVTVTAHQAYAQQYGAVVGDIEPELQLNPTDIQSYGVSTVTELLNELAPQTRSDRGRGGETPVVLLNGRRISSLNEVYNIPTEAILRIDILPEEVSLKYGYTADQRVVNIVLRRWFRATTAELQGGGPTEGGEATGQAELDLLHIRRDDRINLDLKYQGASDITDAARGIIEPPSPTGAPAPADLGEARTLVPATQSLTANAVIAHPMAGGVNATFNATLGATSSDSLQGLAPDGQVLHQYADGWTGHLGTTFNKDLHDWRLSLTGAYDHADTQTDTDLPGQPQASARSISDAANIQILANGPLFKLPGGNFYVSAKAGDTESWQGSTSSRPGAAEAAYLNRNDGNAQLNLDLPLTSRRKNFLPFFGELSLNANAAIDQLSDFGTLKAFGYGLNWTPITGVNLIVSHTNDQAAPTIQQLGSPVLYTPGVRVFDYLTGQTVDVTQVTGGNRALIHDNRNVTKIGLTLTPIPSQNLTVTVNYIKSDIDNPIETFPVASAAIQMAFPDRFVRDDDGDLVLEDIRPVNFATADRSEIRWGINYIHRIGKPPPPRPSWRNMLGPDGKPLFQRPNRGQGGGAAAALGVVPGSQGGAPGGDQGEGPGGGGPGGGGQGGGGFGGGGGGFGHGGGGFGGGRGGGRFGGGGGGPPVGGQVQFAIYHTIYFNDDMLVRPGGPTLNLLDGAPATATGGQYRNEIEAQLGVTDAGFGARLSADWRQGTFEAGVPGSPTGALYFSDITALNLRFFDNLGRQRAVVKRFSWLRGTRVTLNITNLLDDRISVRDAAGATPLSYQPGYLDPTGRTISLSLRKLFY